MNKKLGHSILSNLEAISHRKGRIAKAIELSKAASRLARGN
jgi:hypothetical protein